MGVILTILIINTSVILSLSFSSFSKFISPTQMTEQKTVVTSTTTLVPESSLSIVSEPEDAKSSVVQTSAPTPTKSYIYLEPASQLPNTKHTQSILYYDPPEHVDDVNFTVYSMDNVNVTQTLPRVSVNLVNPPLIIDYNIVANNITDIKYYEYKMMNRTYKVNQEISRAYEDSWFTIKVYDRSTGEIVAEDGYGRTYSLQSPKRLTIYKSGRYRFEFTGDYATITLTMKVKKDGNIL